MDIFYDTQYMSRSKKVALTKGIFFFFFHFIITRGKSTPANIDGGNTFYLLIQISPTFQISWKSHLEQRLELINKLRSTYFKNFKKHPALSVRAPAPSLAKPSHTTVVGKEHEYFQEQSNEYLFCGNNVR